MKLRFIAVLVFFVIPGLSYLSADVYRWTDVQGNVFYGNQPPADARDVKLMFRETAPAPGPGGAVREERPRSTDTIIKEMETEARRDEEQARQKAEGEMHAAPPTRDELIAREKAKLEKQIAELEQKPLDYFGSQKNKRVRIGYYQYRLETLRTNPDEYFANPESFEGNIKTPEAQQ